MRALTPAGFTNRTGLPVYLAIPSEHSAPNHLTPPEVALSVTLFSAPGFNQGGLGGITVSIPTLPLSISGFVISMLTRQRDRPNRVRHPADCSFASNCSPHRISATQLFSATGL